MTRSRYYDQKIAPVAWPLPALLIIIFTDLDPGNGAAAGVASQMFLTGRVARE